MATDVIVSTYVPEKLRDDAVRCLLNEGRTMESAIREFLESTVVAHNAPESPECTPAEHDAWFRVEVQKGLDDPGPYLSNEEVKQHMAELRRKLSQTR